MDHAYSDLPAAHRDRTYGKHPDRPSCKGMVAAALIPGNQPQCDCD